ncbi:MAG: gluconokinase [Pseudomonadota bacterium]
MTSRPTLVICMGVSGSGKSTVAKTLSATCDIALLDADMYHSEANKALMRRGVALTNEQRIPWMLKVCDALREVSADNAHCVLAHSALQRQHRDQLRATGFDTLFVWLDGDKPLIEQRMQARSGHFMPAKLLDTQYATLQLPDDEADVIALNVADTPQQLASQIVAKVDALQVLARESA